MHRHRHTWEEKYFSFEREADGNRQGDKWNYYFCYVDNICCNISWHIWQVVFGNEKQGIMPYFQILQSKKFNISISPLIEYETINKVLGIWFEKSTLQQTIHHNYSETGLETNQYRLKKTMQPLPSW